MVILKLILKKLDWINLVGCCEHSDEGLVAVL
jgi:hypothetical protein